LGETLREKFKLDNRSQCYHWNQPGDRRKKKTFGAKKLKTKKGFTLVEVLVAMLILAGAILALSQSWTGSIFGFRKTQNVQQIVGLLKKKTTELEIKYKRLAFESIPEEESGDFGSDYPEYTWKASAKKLEFPDLSQSLIGKDGGASDMMLSVIKQMTEFFSNSTKELKVSILWKTPKSTLEYSVTTYITIRPEKGFDFDAGNIATPTDTAAATGGSSR
jgi:general secretion pathway protein I